jgi:hypothetical protein
MTNINRQTLSIVTAKSPQQTGVDHNVSPATTDMPLNTGSSSLPPSQYLRRHALHPHITQFTAGRQEVDPAVQLHNDLSWLGALPQLRRAIRYDDPDAIVAMADILRRDNASCMPANVATLLELAIEGKNSREVRKALTELPGVRGAPELFNVAVQRNDLSVVRHMLRQGADPKRVERDIQRNAGPEMQELLRAAKTINDLYPRNADGGAPQQQSKLDRALSNFQLDRAKRILAKEKQEGNLTDVDLWKKYGGDATTRLDIKAALLALGDPVSIEALAEKPRDGTSIMHRGMHALKGLHQAQLAKYKTFPYRSEKHGDPVHNNEAAQFKNTLAPIVCQDLATAWLAQRIRNSNKSDYRIFKDSDAIADNISEDIEITYDRLIAQGVEPHLKRNSEFGQFAVGLSGDMQAIPREANEKERALHMLVETVDHTMAAELKIKYADDGAPTYVLHVYDPNYTASDIRVAVTDLEDLKTLDFAAMLPDKDMVTHYYGDQPDDRVSAFHIISPHALEDQSPGKSDTATSLASRPDVLNPTVLFHLLKRGYVEDLQQIQPKLINHLNTLPAEEQVAFLGHMTQQGEPAFFFALQNGEANTVAWFCDLVLALNLPDADKARLLGGACADGTPALCMALDKGRTESIEKFCNSILQSTLPDSDKIKLVAALDGDGDPGFFRTMQRGHLEATAGFCNSALSLELSELSDVAHEIQQRQGEGADKPGDPLTKLLNEMADLAEATGITDLGDLSKAALLASRNSDGHPALLAALSKKHLEPASTFCQAVLQSTLPVALQVELLSAKEPNGMPALFNAFAGGNADSVGMLCDTVIESGLPNDAKVKLLSAKNADGVPAFLIALQSGNADLAGTFCELVLESNLPAADKAALLAAETPSGIPAWFFAAQYGHANAAETFCQYVLESNLPVADKATLLRGTRKDVAATALSIAVQKGHADFVGTMCQAVLNTESDLSDADRIALITDTDENGFSTLDRALGYDQTNMVGQIVSALAQSGLPPEDKYKLFAGVDDDGMSHLGAIPAPSGETVEAYRQAAKLLGLDNDPTIQSILLSWSSSTSL